MKPLDIFIIVVLIQSVVLVVFIFASMIKRRSKNNKILTEYFEKKAESFKTIKNKGTKKLTDLLFSSSDSK